VDTILILDFGSQYTQLIARRIREIGVYTEIIPGDAVLDASHLRTARGLILSGSPWSVYEIGAPVPDPLVYTCGLPVLGICYGAQRMTWDHGGQVAGLPDREYGRRPVALRATDPLFAGVPDNFMSWMSHGDSIDQLAAGFSVIAVTDNGIPAAIVRRPAGPVTGSATGPATGPATATADSPVTGPTTAAATNQSAAATSPSAAATNQSAAATSQSALWGVQFHPEVTHCEHGMRILENFAVGICGCQRSWTMAAYIDDESRLIRGRVGDAPVLLLISGGVDSTVAGALLLKTLPREQLHLLYIDTGLMRQSESAEVMRILGGLGAMHLHRVDAEQEFLGALAGVDDPERKRHLIGDMFVSVQAKAVASLGLADDYFLAQGTLYTDLIESGKGVGKKAHVIKSHHNVRSPLIEAKRAQGRIVEPLDRLYKDEVRQLGRVLGLPGDVVGRHPFPGPGLGVRVLGEVTREKCDILRAADEIFIAELRARGLYNKIWQAFAVLLPVRSVGVAGDVRTYGWTVVLRAVASTDGMTADVYDFAMRDLREISAAITNKVKAVGRVVYDVSSKPPATIEWE
jgi:GMP synthase (glutamine-hydrolysing)